MPSDREKDDLLHIRAFERSRRAFSRREPLREGNQV